ncbi:hypothetical protein V8E53_000381 [Lactarius tabidus]
MEPPYLVPHPKELTHCLCTNWLNRQAQNRRSSHCSSTMHGNFELDEDDNDIEEQDLDEEGKELASNSESEVSEVFDFGYQEAELNKSEDDDGQSNSDPGSQGDDDEGLGGDPEEGEWEDVCYGFEDLGFASF